MLYQNVNYVIWQHMSPTFVVLISDATKVRHAIEYIFHIYRYLMWEISQ